MKFMVASRLRQETPPEHVLRMIEKFGTWEPAGFEVESLYMSAEGRVYLLAEADSIGPLAEAFAQYASINEQEIIPVATQEQLVPHLQRGYEWAAS